ncbi:hypothetical protein [Methanobacterium sp. ACI-7]|uniref:hypothetical protein n=1 Tax=unclassified Methanobacterium TaxID=2627676 RepID=UPI0039C409BC
MLEYTGMNDKKPIKLFFMDEDSPKDWESLINEKLSDYYENAYIDFTKEENRNITVILELDPSDNEDNDEFIRKQRDSFEEYYDNVLEEIGLDNQRSNDESRGVI